VTDLVNKMKARKVLVISVPATPALAADLTGVVTGVRRSRRRRARAVGALWDVSAGPY
jgi:hypothetical protein